jgi:hypothetical protein
MFPSLAIQCPKLKSYIFWDITKCSPLKVNGRIGGTCRPNLPRSSESFVDFQRIIRRYVPEDRTPHNHCFENLKSNTIYKVAYEYHQCYDLNTDEMHSPLLN